MLLRFISIPLRQNGTTNEAMNAWSSLDAIVHMAEWQVAFQQRRLHLSGGLALGADTRDNRGFRHSGSGGITAKEIIEHVSLLETRQTDRCATTESQRFRVKLTVPNCSQPCP